jgi:lipoate-protein ligase A
MRAIWNKLADPYLAMAGFEVCQEDTIAILDITVDWIYLGLLASHLPLIKSTSKLSIVRGPARGGVYLSEANRNLLFGINTAQLKTQMSVLEILRDAIGNLGITGLSIQSNDVLYQGKQFGMVAPPEQLDNGRYLAVAQITFDVDLNKVEENLLFPADKWADKPGNTNIRQWLLGIHEIKPLVSYANFQTALKSATQAKYGANISLGSLTTDEIALAQKLKTEKYKKDSWTRFGEW